MCVVVCRVFVCCLLIVVRGLLCVACLLFGVCRWCLFAFVVLWLLVVCCCRMLVVVCCLLIADCLL